ncbi:hypothetical protein DYB34_013065 [Aphanomyces astaci]|uniref:Uncharacterized protein n=1 Tax=Aphanomyces astaci TaxID=112090 RepID=A0A418BGY7_APHAT|nr:hypothetical protein DYB34_013065 [Aphanomyces astaci]
MEGSHRLACVDSLLALLERETKLQTNGDDAIGSTRKQQECLSVCGHFVELACSHALWSVQANKHSRDRVLRHRTSIAKAHMQIADFFASASMLFEGLVVWTKLAPAAQDTTVRDRVAGKLALALHNYGAELEHLDEVGAYEVSAACFGKDHDNTKTMGRTLQSFSMALKEGPLSPPPKKCPSPPRTPHDKHDRWRSSTIWPALLKRLHENYTDDNMQPKPPLVIANPMTSMFAPKNVTYAPVLLHREVVTRSTDAPTKQQRPATAKSPWNKTSPPKDSSPYAFNPHHPVVTAARPPLASFDATPHRPKVRRTEGKRWDSVMTYPRRPALSSERQRHQVSHRRVFKGDQSPNRLWPFQYMGMVIWQHQIRYLGARMPVTDCEYPNETH